MVSAKPSLARFCARVSYLTSVLPARPGRFSDQVRATEINRTRRPVASFCAGALDSHRILLICALCACSVASFVTPLPPNLVFRPANAVSVASFVGLAARGVASLGTRSLSPALRQPRQNVPWLFFLAFQASFFRIAAVSIAHAGAAADRMVVGSSPGRCRESREDSQFAWVQSILLLTTVRGSRALG